MPPAAPPTGRVPEHTPESINREIRAATAARVRTLAANPGDIPDRLRELDAEWDVERALETNAATLALVGLGLGVFVDRRWLALPAVVATFLLQHGLQGWCPPLPVLRRLGLRTRREIDWERAALKALRGDFYPVPAVADPAARAEAALDAAGR